jgi:hypothetical protein
MCERSMRLAHEPVAELPVPAPALGDEVVSLRPWHETDVPAKLMAFGDPVVQRPAAYRALQARPTPARAVQSASGARRATACSASSSVIFHAVRSGSARLLAGEGVDRREQRLIRAFPLRRTRPWPRAPRWSTTSCCIGFTTVGIAGKTERPPTGWWPL